MSDKNFGYLGTGFQQVLLKAIIEDRKFAITIIDGIESKYFDGPYFKYLMENIKELFKTLGVLPTYETIEQKILVENQGASSRVHLDTLYGIRDLVVDESNLKFTKQTSKNFCLQQNLKKALKKADDIMENGDFEEYTKIEEIIIEALQFGASSDDIVDATENVLDSLEEDNRVPYPTGITGLDNFLNGGLAKGELGILLAPTGVGKTTFLTRAANTAYNNGANVLHIFFEDPLREIRKKHNTCWTGFSTREQRQHKEEIVEMINEISSNRTNKLKLIKMPAFGVSVFDIKSKIRKLAAEGFRIDLLVLDYVDCISLEKTPTGEEWKGEGAIMRSLEAMTDEFDIALWTATQGNRESIESEVVTTNQMGGNIKKAQIGHVVISVGKTLIQKEQNLATMAILKSRIGKDGIIFPNCKFNNEYLEIDTETQNTLLGFQDEKEQKKAQRAHEVFKTNKEREKKIIEERVDQQIAQMKLLPQTPGIQINKEIWENPPKEETKPEEQKPEPPKAEIPETPKNAEISSTKRRVDVKRAAQIFKERKAKEKLQTEELTHHNE